VKLASPLEANLNEIRNATVQVLGTAPTGVEARIYYDASLHALRYHNGSTWVSVTAVPTGIDVRASVRAASTANVNVASAPSSIDGVSLVNGDRVLLKNQTDATENGIRVFTSAGASLQRASDAATSTDVSPGMFMFVEEGSTNGDKGFVLSTDAPITLGSTNLTFTQFSGATSVTGTSSRITVTGTQIDIASDYVGQATITTLGTVTTGVWQGTAVALANGGTGATSASGARSNLGLGTAAVANVGTASGTVAAGDDSRFTNAAHKYSTNIGDGSATSFTVTHSLNSTAVVVEVFEASTGITVYTDITRTSANAITVGGFASAPTSNQYTVVVVG
jgi:hypothetical protein